MKQLANLLLVLTAAAVVCTASPVPSEHFRKTTTTTEPPPSPYQYYYQAGRAPGAKPDRYVQQKGDESGKITGSYTYLDPNWNWQRVVYAADKEHGFQILEGSTIPQQSPPSDTVAVSDAKQRHQILYQQIAETHQQVPVPQVNQKPLESAAVQQRRYEDAQRYHRIQAEHQRIADEHALLAAAAEEEERKRIAAEEAYEAQRQRYQQ